MIISLVPLVGCDTAFACGPLARHTQGHCLCLALPLPSFFKTAPFPCGPPQVTAVGLWPRLQVRGTKEMMQPCIIYLHVISLVAHTPPSYRFAPRGAAFSLRCPLPFCQRLMPWPAVLQCTLTPTSCTSNHSDYRPQGNDKTLAIVSFSPPSRCVFSPLFSAHKNGARFFRTRLSTPRKALFGAGIPAFPCGLT